MILLSPAKTQDFTTAPDTRKGSKPAYIAETGVLCGALRTYNVKELGSLMHISDALADLNVDRFATWSPHFAKQKQNQAGTYNFKQAIFAFRGDVYFAFENNSFSAAEFDTMEKRVLIISGFYGLLTPLTFIKPYRLEMKTQLSFAHKGTEYKNLYEYWRDLLTCDLKSQLKKDEIIINLASNEYAKAIHFTAIPNEKIDVTFKNRKNGVTKIVAVYAKRQRGEMAVWLIKNKAHSVMEMKKYKNDGYAYSAALSTKQNLVFLKQD